MVADFYGIPIWSFYDVAHSNYTRTQQNSYMKRLQYKMNFGHDTHPPWDVHLFQADLYASDLLLEFELCKSNFTKLISREKQIFEILKTPMFKTQAVSQCAENIPKLLSFSYENIKNNKTTTGSYFSNPVTSWKVREDRVGKGGFIFELNSSNAESSINHQDLIFVFNNLTKHQMINSRLLLLLNMLYLRSYENAGAVEIYFCDVLLRLHQPSSLLYLNHVDALWPDFTDYRYSLPSLYTNLLSYQSCNESKVDNSLVTLKIRHKYLADAFQLVRKNQKFKITNIDVCFPVVE